MAQCMAKEPHSPSQRSIRETASAADLLMAGIQIARAGRLNEAAEIFAKAILKDPSSAEAYEALATVLVPLGKLEFAIRAKAKAISLGYNSASSWEMLGEMFVSLGQFADATEAFGTALDLEPDAAELRSKLHTARSRSAAQTRVVSSEPIPSPARPDADLFGPEFLSTDPLPPAWRRVSLGVDAERRNNAFGNSGINLLLGAHLIGSQELAERIPWNNVIINLEQVTGFVVRSRPIYLSLLNRLAVWDYSVRNIEELRRITRSPYVRHFAIGYTPAMTRHLERSAQTTDVTAVSTPAVRPYSRRWLKPAST
jgi:tetratricopeptide (TPR) repeat protein